MLPRVPASLRRAASLAAVHSAPLRPLDRGRLALRSRTGPGQAALSAYLSHFAPRSLDFWLLA